MLVIKLGGPIVVDDDKIPMSFSEALAIGGVFAIKGQEKLYRIIFIKANHTNTCGLFVQISGECTMSALEMKPESWGNYKFVKTGEEISVKMITE
jgi:hypothetical protein